MNSSKLEADTVSTGALVCVPLLSGQTAGTLKGQKASGARTETRSTKPVHVARRFALFFTLLLVRKAGCLRSSTTYIRMRKQGAQNGL